MAESQDCAKTGTFWSGTPTAHEKTFGGVRAYVATPKTDSGKAVVIVPDVAGWEFKNSRLLADRFAEAGFTTALPDLMRDDKPDLDKLVKGDFTGFEEWREKLTPERVNADLEKLIAGLKSELGIKSVGITGYCWGGRFAVHIGATDKVQAVVMNHGSYVLHDDISAVKQPFLINASDKDKFISRERLAQFQGILDCKENLPNDVKFYEGMNHGWAVRGDDADPKVGPEIKDAFQRAAQWFKKHL